MPRPKSRRSPETAIFKSKENWIEIFYSLIDCLESVNLGFHVESIANKACLHFSWSMDKKFACLFMHSVAVTKIFFALKKDSVLSKAYPAHSIANSGPRIQKFLHSLNIIHPKQPDNSLKLSNLNHGSSKSESHNASATARVMSPDAYTLSSLPLLQCCSLNQSISPKPRNRNHF